MRGRRRRRKQPWQQTTVSRFLVTPDHFEVLTVRATKSRVRWLLGQRRLGAADAFALLDTNGAGAMSVEELCEALAWLGLHCSPDDTRALVVSIDSNGDGVVTADDFCLAIGGDIEMLPADQQTTLPALAKRRVAAITRTASTSNVLKAESDGATLLSAVPDATLRATAIEYVKVLSFEVCSLFVVIFFSSLFLFLLCFHQS